MAISDENLQFAWAPAFPSQGTGRLTVLDYYAAAALTGLIARAGAGNADQQAKLAWELAEAMVEQRPERPGGGFSVVV